LFPSTKEAAFALPLWSPTFLDGREYRSLKSFDGFREEGVALFARNEPDVVHRWCCWCKVNDLLPVPLGAGTLQQVSASNQLEGNMATAGKPEVPDSNEELVKVFDSDLESEVMVVKGLLESAGIDSIINSIDAQQDILPGVGGVILLVRADQADEAHQVIDENLAAGEAGADAAEAEGELSAETENEPPA
jgi:hypothetical protein